MSLGIRGLLLPQDPLLEAAWHGQGVLFAEARLSPSPTLGFWEETYGDHVMPGPIEHKQLQKAGL